ncbi:MAG: GNVR domain-containing protein [Chitinophagales bacterium]
MSEQQNLVSATRILLKWKKHILGVSILSAVVAALVALFVLDEYYLSQSVFYPINQSQNDRSIIFNGAQVMAYYGDKNDVNRLLTMANSKQLIEEIIEQFGIVEHYKIDKNKPFWKTKVYKKFLKNYAAIKTEKDAIEVSLFDTDPKLAATIVNTIVKILDTRNSKAIKENRSRLLTALEEDIQKESTKLSGLNLKADSLIKEHKLRITFSQYGELLVGGDNFLARETVRQLFREINNTQREMLNKSNIQDQLKVSVANTVSSISVVEKAEAADRREKPQRTLIVIIAFTIAFIFSCIGALLLEQFNTFRKQLNAA